jgi:hypothetical protein
VDSEPPGRYRVHQGIVTDVWRNQRDDGYVVADAVRFLEK